MKRATLFSRIGWVLLATLMLISGAQAKTLKVVTGYGDIDRVTSTLNTILAEFRKEHPDVEFDIEYIGGGYLVERVPILTAAGMPPDIIFLWSFDFANLARQGYFLPLDSYVAPDLADLYFPGLLQDAMANGELAGLPLYGGPAGINYNMYHFADAGIADLAATDTMDEFVAKAKALTRDHNGDGTIDRWGFVWYSFVLRDWITWVWRNGGDAFSADRTELMLHEPAAAEALQWLADLTHVHGATPAHGVLYGSPWTLWTNQTASMYPSGAWDMGRLYSQPFPLDVARFPQNKVDETAAEAYFVSVHRHTKEPELAAAVAQFIATTDFAQREFFQLGYGIPFITEAAVEYFLRPDAGWNRLAFIEPLQLGTARVMPYPANWDQVQATLRTRYQQDLWSGQKPAAVVGLEVKPVVDGLINAR